MIRPRFRLEAHHVELLSRATIQWESGPTAGAPFINPCLPYGHRPPLQVVADVLGLEHTRETRPVTDHDGHRGHASVYPPATIKRCREVHRETELALAVILATRSFEPGQYEHDGHKWRRAK